MSALCPAGIDTPLLDSKGPADLPPTSYDVRRFLRRVGGKEHPPDSFVAKALRGVAKNKALVVEPARTRVASWIVRHAPRLGEMPMRRAMRQERAAVGSG